MKRLICLAVFIMLFSAAFMGIADASTSTQPAGYIALKAVGVPAGTPASAQLSWTFNGMPQNATYSSPTCLVNITQVLAADANKTTTGETISTPLNKTYADDDDYYTVGAAGTGPYAVDFTLNVTLSNHYITNASWITDAWVTIYGNVSALCDTAADLYIYNFTGGTWKWLGHYLNYTTEHAENYHIGALSNFADRYIDTSHSNTIMFRIYCNDSDTDFTLAIDYFKVDITYSLPISVEGWSATDDEIQYGNMMVFSHTETFNLTAPSGITSHNFTVYYVTPNYNLIADIGHSVSATVSGSTVSVASPIAFNITNLVENQTELNMYLPLVYLCGAPSGVTVSSISFQGGINKLTFTASGTGTKTFTVRIKSEPYGIYIDNVRLPSANYTWSNGLLTANITLSSHTIEIYQYNPSPAPTPAPPPEEEEAPTPTPEEILIEPAHAALIVAIMVVAVIAYILIRRH